MASNLYTWMLYTSNCWSNRLHQRLWAYNTSNQSDWEVKLTPNQYTSDEIHALLVGDTIYFDADDGTTGRELWAHNHLE